MNTEQRDELTRLLPPPGDPALSAARGRVLKDAFLREIGEPRRAPRRMTALVPAAAAALVTVIVVLAGVALRGGPQPMPAPSATPPPVIALPPVHAAGVAARADAAAARASLPPAVAIRADQFVYIRSRVAFEQTTFEPPPADLAPGTAYWPSHPVIKPALETVRIREMWLPQRGYQAFVHDGEETFDVYASTANGTYASLPTDPAKLLPRIYAETEGQGPGPDYSAFDWIGETMRETMLPPRTYVTLYRTAARIPGVVLVDDAVDGAGRHGIAVAFEHLGERREWIFDPRTFDYLGERSYMVEDGPSRPAGTITGLTAVLRRAVVDGRGERPR
ncbi:CU044_5270 family protein [Actinoplanes sp. NPDC049668]|uniref:CU044_5270 family protein n=1 Tax=unclassified Actinoplanes TaxID=2626549 RepID=UPI0033A3BF6D